MAEEKLERANFYGAEKIIAGRGGAAGGSGGGGLALTGGAYVGAEGGITSTNRWLRFDFNDPNHKSLIILGGTSFTIGENIVSIEETTSYNLSDYISEEGADYYVFINAEGRVVCSTLRTQPDGYMFIGQFHTLCNGVAANTTVMVPEQTGITVGTSITLCDYFKNQDLDFANFYTKTVDAANDGTPYAVATVLHPLQGFNTMDILPESVWCLNFHPKCKNWDGMVYCNSINKAVDIYLQSGIGSDTKSEYGAVHTVSRQWLNFQCDMQTVGKSLVSFSEFIQFALGSNERTVIQGATDKSTVGGHVDSSGKRMISFIGVEECCGYLWQNMSIVSQMGESNTHYIGDGRGLLGVQTDILTSLVSGGYWGDPDYSGSGKICGSRCVGGNGNFINAGSNEGARGCCDISIV